MHNWAINLQFTQSLKILLATRFAYSMLQSVSFCLQNWQEMQVHPGFKTGYQPKLPVNLALYLTSFHRKNLTYQEICKSIQTKDLALQIKFSSTYFLYKITVLHVEQNPPWRRYTCAVTALSHVSGSFPDFRRAISSPEPTHSTKRKAVSEDEIG